MEETTKLGRCECREPQCDNAHGWLTRREERETGGQHDRQCSYDAVGMVTVRPKANSSGFIESDGFGHPARLEVPMCQACADFHGKVRTERALIEGIEADWNHSDERGGA